MVMDACHRGVLTGGGKSIIYLERSAATLAMAPKRKQATQKALTSAGFWPLLPKTAVAIGKFVSVPGKFWDGCPSADKEKQFKCIVVDFIAVHDFGAGRKGSAFSLKEMGEGAVPRHAA